MLAWMNAETLRMTLDEGRMVYWSRSRQEIWRKGDTSGDHQVVHEALLRLRRRRAAVQGRSSTATAPATPASAPASTGGSGPTERAHPAEPRRLPRPRRAVHGRAGLGRAARRPRDPGRGVRQARRRRARLPARVGRARRALEPLLVRRSRPGRHAAAARRPGRGHRQAARRGADRSRHPRRARAPPRDVPGAGHPRAAAAARRDDGLPRLRRDPRGRAPAERARPTTATCPTR